MSELWLTSKDFYWIHRDVFRIAAAGGLLCFAQIAILLWTLRRLGELSNMRERMSRLADGLALLTDTTEAGLAAVAQQMEQLARTAKAPRPASRASVAKRVTDAVRKGERVARIAEYEALSESEVRLHLAMSDRDRTPAPPPLAS
jgi:hypothetical protein